MKLLTSLLLMTLTIPAHAECLDVMSMSNKVSPAEAIALKIIILIILISSPIAAYKTNGNWIDKIGAAVITPICIIGAGLAFLMIYIALRFVFS